MCKISGPKIWSCKFFDKSQVCAVDVDDNGDADDEGGGEVLRADVEG